MLISIWKSTFDLDWAGSWQDAVTDDFHLKILSITLLVLFRYKIDFDKTSTQAFHVTICMGSLERSTCRTVCPASVATLFTRHLRTISATWTFFVYEIGYGLAWSRTTNASGAILALLLCNRGPQRSTGLNQLRKLAQISPSHSWTRTAKDEIAIGSTIVQTTLCIQQPQKYVLHNEIEHIILPHDRLAQNGFNLRSTTTPTFDFLSYPNRSFH